MKIRQQVLYVSLVVFLFCPASFATMYMVPKISNDVESDNYNQLFAVVQTGNLAGIETLLNKGVDINGRDPYLGRTALMYASDQGLKQVVKFLLEKGADVNAKTDGGETALMAASVKGDPDIVKLLLDKGTDVDAKTTSGRTALLTASQTGNTDAVRLLLVKGADVNVKAKDGTTALMEAMKNGHTDVVQLLEKAGAKAGKKDYIDAYNSVAMDNLRKAATAEEAFYINNMTYCDSIERLEGNAYGLHVDEGITVKVISADAKQYHIIAFHEKGDKKYRIFGPYAKIEEYSE